MRKRLLFIGGICGALALLFPNRNIVLENTPVPIGIPASMSTQENVASTLETPVAQETETADEPEGATGVQDISDDGLKRKFSPEMKKLVQGIQDGKPIQVSVGTSSRHYLFRSKHITSDDFKISTGPETGYPSSFEIFEGRQILSDGSLTQMAKLAVVNDTVSMAYTTEEGEFLIERDDHSGQLVARMLVNKDPNSNLGDFACTETMGRTGVMDRSGDAPKPNPVEASISLAGGQEEGIPEKEGALASHPYFRLGPEYDASLKTIRVLMVSGSTQTGSSSNLSSRAASYFTYAATAADVYERQLGFEYHLQELVLIADDSGGPDIEAIPNNPNDFGDDDQLAAWNWAQSYRPKSTHNWGHLTAWVDVDPGSSKNWIGWAYLDSYGKNSILSVSVNERAWTWGVHIHEMGHNVGASHTIGSGGAMNPTVSKSNPKEDFFTQSENGAYTAAKDIYNYMSQPSVNNLSGPADLRNPGEMPFGVDDAVTTTTDTPVTFNPLTNDDTSTLFGSTNTLSLVEVGQVFPKAAGTAAVSGDEITFIPVGGYTGNVWFSYTLSGDVGNGGQGWLHSADVVVTVGGNSSNPSQSPSISTTDDSLNTNFSAPIRLNPLLNDEGKGRLWAGGVDALSDVDGTAESYSDGAFFLVSATVISGGNGSLMLETVEMNRDASGSTGNTGYLVYTPNGSEAAVVEIEYTVKDADGNQSTGTIYLNDGDSDNDGMSDEAELLAGTDPDDPASTFTPTVLAVEENEDIRFTIPTTTDHFYRVYYRDSLVSGSWAVLPGYESVDSNAVHPVTVQDSPVGTTNRFYRIEVRMDPWP